ncbi:Alpha/Beta hydrolase protein [Xylariaceae sp. FL0255]|nr:Alpha/Beta hydrolase protein [Xylariaceae sp. FL0255]
MASTPKTSSISSDLTLPAGKFSPSAVSEETIKIKTMLGKAVTTGPSWFDVGAVEWRRMRDAGELAFPMAVKLPRARDTAVPSRDSGRDIPVRVVEPENGVKSRGILLHFHGGGFVVNTHQDFDAVLARYADECQLTAISVGYRLAPEHPYPAAPEDALDVAEYLIDHGEERFNGLKLSVLTGESAGGCLATVTTFALMRSRPSHSLAALVFNFAQFDVAGGLPLPSTYTKPYMINKTVLSHSAEAYTPGMSAQDRKAAGISPLYEDLEALAAEAPTKKLPPAIFHIGTDDPFLDENILMSAKWQITGSEGISKFYPGCAHGFTAMGGKEAAEAAALTKRFLEEKLEAAS